MESKQDQEEITVLKIDSNGTIAGKHCYHREGNTKPWNWRARGETGQSGGARLIKEQWETVGWWE